MRFPAPRYPTAQKEPNNCKIALAFNTSPQKTFQNTLSLSRGALETRKHPFTKNHHTQRKRVLVIGLNQPCNQRIFFKKEGQCNGSLSQLREVAKNQSHETSPLFGVLPSQNNAQVVIANAAPGECWVFPSHWHNACFRQAP